VSPLAAQYGAARRLKNPQVVQQQLPMVDVSGTLERAGPGMLGIATSQQQNFLVSFNPRTTMVTCTGTAEPSFLRPGMFVRFSGQFDKKGKLTAEIDKLTIITLNKDTRPGIYPDENLAGAGEEDAAAPAAAAAAADSSSYWVVGAIRGFKDGQLHVHAGGQAVAVVLAEEPTIDVEVNDLTFIQQGDTVEAKGGLVSPAGGPNPGKLMATEVKVTLAKPLAAPDPEKPMRGKGARGGRKGAERAEKAGEPEAAPDADAAADAKVAAPNG
jgi:hypothetical protein